ncbi:peptidase domain-containing ABC transporter [uncultured Dokdonia sp.]|uniref:peptidase domain-containing ABC transporter n=1 Tax=uncultured Dokdonia sp. TaxID=575653 RepID=UPI002615988A|nr:peptidase domain-containing ABC transporter [uncultured Dokdonia sp.]
MKQFPFYKQADFKDCGPTCLKIIAKHYDKVIPIQKLRTLSETTRAGSHLIGISEAAEKIGFRTLGVKITLEDLRDAPLPCILHWNKNHYVVLYKIKKNTFYISDPAHGLLKYNKKDFLKSWLGLNVPEDAEEGITLLIELTPRLFENEYEDKEKKIGLSFILRYLTRYKSFLWQLILGLVGASILQFIFPFLTQSIVDIGIKNSDIHFIYLILFAQLALFLGRTAIEIVRSWILLHLSTRINISLISDFFIKLMKLPIAFFDVRMTGDILQRIGDHSRIERILTTSSLNVLFSVLNLFVFSIVLAYYNVKIFTVFILGSILYFLWITLFLKRRADLDYKQFSQVSQEQSKVIELINGMQEIKLHNAEKQKRWGWEFMQARLFKLSIEGLVLEQYQNVGSGFINELKNILITVLSATLVIDGEITIGVMLAISYIVGQLNSPISQLISFVREIQDAKIALDRLSEIHGKDEEETGTEEQINTTTYPTNFDLKNVSFRYVGASKNVLENLNIYIPENKVTAIVGTSGSGKTTLIKLLLKFYEQQEGTIKTGNVDLKNISPSTWRSRCGVVMQEGYIFNDTIANNIAVGEDFIDKEKLIKAVEIANIKDFIETLPLSYNTKIGNEGVGISTGQKQRLLIARAVYKNPEFIFFDEATSALDANNERVIIKNLEEFFKDRTVLIVAHRLSTVKRADQIIVLDKGHITEVGNHDSLIEKKGDYYHLVKNQLELGK